MNVHFPVSQRTWPGRLVNLAVVVVVLAIAAATFVLSYPGVHAIVAQAGVSARLSRIYPGLFDALFVVACVAAVMLRDTRWWARCYAWLVIVVVVAVVGAADAVHAMNVTLPHRTVEGVVAATPWVIVLLGFSLMLAMLRQSRTQHAAAKAPAAPGELEQPEQPGAAADAQTAEEHEQPEQPGAAADAQTAEEQEQPEQPSATAGAGSGPDEHDQPVAGAGEQGAESAAAPPFFDHWKSDEESGQDDSGHPATVPGQVIDDDAPPFATAPFATVPRLNRVRSTPTPPDDDEQEE